jgi:aspartyl-tRNA(Asn)/glutamyl-tRNA(Gln) amidotransferase subunit A
MTLIELTAAQAAEKIRRREISPVELVEALLNRIEATEPALEAWETIDREGALAAAREAERQAGMEGVGPLHGVPLGVKDIFFTASMRTTSGSAIFKDFVPEYDATPVARVREAGAIILGKTVTVEFAHHDPPRTRNPWNRERTPGGSSSGSAAAVAARMVPAALGSQTGGSVLRPASYCGTVGLKPTYGRVSRYGVTPNSWSLDHVGVLARSVEDTALVLQAMAGPDPRDATSASVPAGNYLEAARRKDRAPRLGLVPDYLERADEEMAAHCREVAAHLESAGAEVREVALPQSLEELTALRFLIATVEVAAVHSATFSVHREQYSRAIREIIETGHLIPASAYMHAQQLRRRWRPRVEAMLEGVDCLLMPSVNNTAPGPSTTGSSAFQAVWSLFGLPSISLPSGLSRERLPLGTQLVAPSFEEEGLLSAAAWCEEALGPMPAPDAE